MYRLRLALAALALFAVSCGGSDTQDLLTDLGLSEEEAACLTREYEARDLDVDKLLRADDNTDLSEEELAGLADVAAVCAPTADSGDDSGEQASGDDADTGTTDTDTDTGDTDTDDDDADSADGTDPDGDTGDTDSGDTDGDDGDPVDEPVDDADATELSPLEQEFVAMLAAEGLDEAAGICLLTELEAVGFSIFDLAALGLNEEAEPHPDMIAAFLRCGDEFVDAGITDFDDIFGDDGGGFGEIDDDSVDTYGDDPDLDMLWDACAASDWVACDELYWISPIGSDYETYGSTCANTAEPTSGGCDTIYGSGESAYGDDPVLDGLHDDCAAGDMAACDELYWDSPIGSEYETFAVSCGGTRDGFNGGTCADGGEPFTYGDDADLDADWDACAGGDMAACDALYLWSPFDSEYEAFGSTCGGLSTEELFGDCEAELG